MKIDVFKYIIKEFHEASLPELKPRKLEIPPTQKIITIAGSRRTGKTFFFYQKIKELLDKGTSKEQILYINFEDDRLLPLKLNDMNDLMDAYYELYPDNKGKTIYLFLDEIQNIEKWEIFVRRIYDKEKVKIFITGSSSKLLSKEIATSLRGRTLSFYLFPLSFVEFLEFNNIRLDKNFVYSKKRFKIKNLLEKYIKFGGFPEVVLEKNKLEGDILRNYFDMFIYKDLVERFSIRNITLLKNLTKFLLTNISCVFSVNSYYKTRKQHSAVGKDTISEYCSYLEDINLVFFVPLFSYSLRSQQTNPKKTYCLDTGLRNSVCFSFSEDIGKLVENVVFIELKRSGKEVYYWKSREKSEVDFIIKNNDNSLSAINVTYSNKINEREIKSLRRFK
ncbi:MAG TPA: ATP-binding protein, partial [Candidatus Atribacteria bacterium]|nr:ATP-binding protein [Candidatus Atribacteria bacterium]